MFNTIIVILYFAFWLFFSFYTTDFLVKSKNFERSSSFKKEFSFEINIFLISQLLIITVMFIVSGNYLLSIFTIVTLIMFGLEIKKRNQFNKLSNEYEVKKIVSVRRISFILPKELYVISNGERDFVFTKNKKNIFYDSIDKNFKVKSEKINENTMEISIYFMEKIIKKQQYKVLGK